MKKMKLTTTLVCALTVLAFTTTAWAEWYLVPDEEIDEFLEKLAAEEVDDDLYESQFDGVDMDTTRSCVHCRPIAYIVAFQRSNDTWWVTTDVRWDFWSQLYYVCDGTHANSVYAVRMHWKTTSSNCCNYCSGGEFTTGQYYNYGGWPVSYENVTGDKTCILDFWTGDRLYRAVETTYYNNFSFNPQGNWPHIGRMNSPTVSRIDIRVCID